MRVMVTGAAGFTGVYLMSALAAAGHEAVPLEGDVLAPDLADRLAETRPDAIVHLAGRAFVASADLAGFYEVNQIGSFNLLDAAARVRPGIGVLLASSAQVYGAGASGLIDEGHALRPSNHYALSKMAMELGSDFWTDRLRITSLRLFNYTGVGQEPRYLIPKIVDHFRRREPRIRLGNMDVRRDFGDVRAVADAYVGLLGLETPAPVYNVSTGQVESVRAVVDLLTRITGHHIEVEVDPAFVRSNDVPVLGGDNSRLRAALPQWSPRRIEETLTWMLDQG